MSSESSFDSLMEKSGVTKLNSTRKVPLRQSKPEPSNSNTEAAKRKVLIDSLAENPESSSHEIDGDEELRKSGLRISEFKDLKQGKIHRQDEVYIRGYTVTESTERLQSAIVQAVNSGYRCIKVIHGKGLNSPDGISKIKLNTQHLLRRNRYVLGYCNAVRTDGGAGAKYVLLKRR